MRALTLALLPLSVFAAVDGVVVNQTTGKPQPNVMVTLVQPGQGGIQALGSAKSDARGKFKIDQAPGEQTHGLLQAIHGGVTYTKMLQPGEAASAVELAIYDSTSRPGTAVLNQRVIVLQPGDGGLQVNEMYLMRNTGKTTFHDPAKGSMQFYVAAGHGDLRVNVSAPGGMPVQRPAASGGAANVFKVDYPIKPGETRFDVTYSVKTPTGEFSGKTLIASGETRLVVPDGVAVEGAGLEEVGTEPKTKAKIYNVKTDAFAVRLSGQGRISLEGEGGTGSGGGGATQEEDTGQPPLVQSNPRIYERLPLVMGLGGAILLLGFILLYRSSKA